MRSIDTASRRLDSASWASVKDSPAMTASTGINALAHCLEALYSTTRNPLSTAAALGGIRAIAFALPRCYNDGSDLEATVSAGCAALDPLEPTREALLRTADVGLYMAKRAGRNQVVAA